MKNSSQHLEKNSYLLSAILFGFLVTLPVTSFASDLSGHMTQEAIKNSSSDSDQNSLSPGHRLVEGTVEAINENSIKVDAGDAGGLTPRYLNLDNQKNDSTIQKGDRLQIEVNAQNKAVNFKKIDAQSSSNQEG